MKFFESLTLAGWLWLGGTVVAVPLGGYILSGLYCVERVKFNGPVDPEGVDPARIAPKAYDKDGKLDKDPEIF